MDRSVAVLGVSVLARLRLVYPAGVAKDPVRSVEIPLPLQVTVTLSP